MLGSCAFFGVCAAVFPMLHVSATRWVYNLSDSVPQGWYRIELAGVAGGDLRVDDIVLARLPTEVSAFAAHRGYLPAGIPLLKRVGALAPQRVCMVGSTVYVDELPVAVARSADGLGRQLSSWPHCRPLHVGELFLLSTTNPSSFDSRYFGPIDAAAVRGRAHPVWTWSAR